MISLAPQPKEFAVPAFRLRTMEERDRWEVAELICASMNVWDILHGMAPGRFGGGPPQTDVFYQVYEQLDPGYCPSPRRTAAGSPAPATTANARRTRRSGS
jgi:hypothetical protein